jgi:hypothetical protein
MSDKQATLNEGPGSGGMDSSDSQALALKLTAAASGAGHHLATSLARRRLIRTSAAIGSAAVAQHYVKPGFQSLGVPAALAVSGPKDKDKDKDKKPK